MEVHRLWHVCRPRAQYALCGVLQQAHGQNPQATRDGGQPCMEWRASEGSIVTRLSEERINYLNNNEWPEFAWPEALELVRGYRDFRAMLREWVAARTTTILPHTTNDYEMDEGALCEDCWLYNGAHDSECLVARTEALLAGEGH